MKIQTFSIVVGTRACDAHCPFCVSRMTGFDKLPSVGKINEVNFAKAARLAQLGQTTTVLMTGKGEPTLYPREITRYLELLQPYRFPFIELQTSALGIGWMAQGEQSLISGLTTKTLQKWHTLGLNTIAISVVSMFDEDNERVYHKDYPDLAAIIAFLRKIGFTIRLCVMMHRGIVDTPEHVQQVVAFCQAQGVDQMTIRPIDMPDNATRDCAVAQYVGENRPTEDQLADISSWIREHGTLIMTLSHGAEVFDVTGQNLCLSDCLTLDPATDDIRTLIFYSDGRLTYAWQHEGAVLLSGTNR